DAHTVYLLTDQPTAQPGSPVTTSGYPRIAHRWRRGASLSEAEPIISVSEEDMVASASFDSTPGHQRHIAQRVLGFYDAETYLIDYDRDDEPTLRLIDVPTDV